MLNLKYLYKCNRTGITAIDELGKIINGYEILFNVKIFDTFELI